MNHFERWLQSLARAQVRRPLRFVALCGLAAVVAALLASQLELRTRFEHLLPETRPSVIELKRLQKDVRAGSHVFIVIEAGDVQAQRAFGDQLVERIRRAAPPWLVHCEDGVHEARAFLAPRAGMFARLGDLQQLRDDVEARWAWEVAQETGANLDDEPPPSLGWQELRSRFGLPSAEQFPDGYYQAGDGRALIVNVTTTVAAGDLPGARQAIDRIRAAAEELRREPAHSGLKLSYAGDLVTGLSEYGAALSDLVHVGALGLALVVLVVFLFFLRLRALVALALTLCVGLAWTFGITELAIGHLNVATGFLISIVAGNGINFGIIYAARVYEEHRKGHSLEAAIERSSALTWRATLAAALAAGAAYSSLGISEFRAFRHFALIGGVGVLVCWLSTYLMLPSVLLLAERMPLFGRAPKSGQVPASWGMAYGEPIAKLVGHAPRLFTLVGVGLAAAGLLSLVSYVRSDPMEYDMRRMQNDLGGGGEMYRASKLASEIMGASLDSSMVLLADHPGQTPLLEQTLEARRDASPAALKPFENVHTVFDFVPKEQAEKLPILLQIRERVRKAQERGLIRPDEYRKFEAFLPPAELAPWTVAELPAAVTRPFQDAAGVVGRLALIEPTAGQSDADVKYLMRWADSFREVKLPNGELVRGSGRAVIFADILKTVLHDIPRTVIFSLLMTVGTVLLTFRHGGRSATVIAALVVGLGWVALAMTLLGIKINFFNFVALPISFGIGVDYAVNFVLRYDEDPRAGALGVLRSTGGAIILCSLTTVLGYLALLVSVNQAIRSLGLLAVMGELGCLAAATLVLPAYFKWREQAAGRSQLQAEAAGANASI